ncbi:hypothetical protein B9Z55_027900 [Caenorhabditis nigoni]|uniref:Uncharacterized protein n=1 Tax=Caenorhabditis nigoni TaxID=1611254 RepID=A0A2G5SEC3_9PELO|nr:hypothetical protein B9Z55_027900 [Caenorhabditis nigoni]
MLQLIVYMIQLIVYMIQLIVYMIQLIVSIMELLRLPTDFYHNLHLACHATTIWTPSRTIWSSLRIPATWSLLQWAALIPKPSNPSNAFAKSSECSTSSKES